jgi:hypothetical protein
MHGVRHRISGVRGFGVYQLTLTDSAFDDVSLISKTFPGLTNGTSGDVITIDIPFTAENPPDLFAASFDVNGVPEPSTFVLMGLAAVLSKSLLRLTVKQFRESPQNRDCSTFFER